MLKVGGAASSIPRTRSGLNPGSIWFTFHQLRTSRPGPAGGGKINQAHDTHPARAGGGGGGPAPVSRIIASAKPATTSARRIWRVAAPTEALLPPAAAEERKSRRRVAI